MADDWKEVFERSRVVPPARQTVRQALDNHITQSNGFQLKLTAALLPQSQEMSGGGQDVSHQMRVTLFDRNHQHFFGKTWRSSPQKMKNNKISLNEVLYFHTSLRVPSAVAVLELVSLSPMPNGSQQAVGRGFTVLELFTNRPEVLASDGVRRLNLHHGSPRNLLHPLFKDTVYYGSLLKTIDGAHFDCVVKKHPALEPLMHLLPENALVSGNENIPGLAASPTGDALLRPHLVKMLPFSLNGLTVSLQPSLEKFESELLQLINADCHNTTSPTRHNRLHRLWLSLRKEARVDGVGTDTIKQPALEGFTPRTVVIQERRLLVGVHNGWCFLDKPQVVVLEPLASQSSGRSDSTSEHSNLSEDSFVLSTLTQVLESSLELWLTNHQALAIVFQLEYVFSSPIGRETMLSATSAPQAAFLQCLRWGSWCPFQEPADWNGEEIQLVLRGGGEPNPYGVMVYSTEMSAKTPSPAPLSAPGSAQKRVNVSPLPEKKDTLMFRLSSSAESKSSSPKTSVRTKQEDRLRHRRSPSSRSRGQRSDQDSPESPQGPGKQDHSGFLPTQQDLSSFCTIFFLSSK